MGVKENLPAEPEDAGRGGLGKKSFLPDYGRTKFNKIVEKNVNLSSK